MALKEIVEQTVAGLGLDLVEIERSAGGLLRITIDRPWPKPEAQALDGPFVTVEDCEKVTRQLQFALEVEGIEYKRLEVSSPGIDRLLRHENDFERFAGQVIDITLKAPLGVTATPLIDARRKKFRGRLEAIQSQDKTQPLPQALAAHWQIVWSEEPVAKPGQRISKKRPPAPLHTLRFALSELREARLAPLVSFNGRGPKAGTEDFGLN